MAAYYTPDSKLLAHPDYERIKSCLDRLCASDTVTRLPGNCISACDILQNMLTFYDIPSRIIECQAMFIKQNQAIKDFLFVGFNNVNVDHGTVDSHVVIVTNTEPPILIDAACGHLMPQHQQIICRVLDNVDPTVIATFAIDDITVTYHHKKIIRLPGLHQKTLIDRMREEQDTKHRIRFLTRMLWILFGIACYNFLANNALLVLKMIYP
jgi:hypothetical protein